MTTKWTVHTTGTESTQNVNGSGIGKPELEKPVESPRSRRIFIVFF